jgi:Fe-S-cluster containining protein
MPEHPSFPAGDFSIWLQHTRKALFDGTGSDVACGECIGCCSSSYFIHIRQTDTAALARIPKDILVAAPGFPKGNLLMGYDENGLCPMLCDGKCTIYEHRPQTCRDYDCRVFAAAGIAAGGGDKAVINQHVKRWKFSYPTAQDRAEHLAVQAAASFMQKNAASFPRGRVPENPSQLAILALKVYPVFLGTDNDAHNPQKIASAVIEASRAFDKKQV